jgi:hypothetical protein
MEGQIRNFKEITPVGAAHTDNMQMDGQTLRC